MKTVPILLILPVATSVRHSASDVNLDASSAIHESSNESENQTALMRCDDMPTCRLCFSHIDCVWTPSSSVRGGYCGTTMASQAFRLYNYMGNKMSSDPLEARDYEDISVEQAKAKCKEVSVLAPTPGSPESWFLSEDDITQSRNGSERMNIMPWTGGNAVKSITGDEVFRKFAEDLANASEDDFVYMSNWGFHPDVPLVPGNTKTVGEHIMDAVRRNVRFVGLVWSTSQDKKLNAKVVDYQKDLAPVIAAATKENGRRSSLRLDRRCDKTRGSIHEKFTIAQQGGDRLHAMIGGIDFAWNRWDTAAHNDPPSRKAFKKSSNTPGKDKSWVDRHVTIVGPGAADLANAFVERWSSSLADGDPGTPGAEDWQDPGRQTRVGSVSVQQLRTYPTYFNMHDMGLSNTYDSNPFAKDGEFSYLFAYVKAVSLATNHVYIEDQYGLFQWELFLALGRALERGVHLTVLYAAESSVHKVGCQASRYKMLQSFMNAFPGQIDVYVRKEGFVHSKIWIVDDVWMAVGSANINYRSFTYDPEIGVAVVDEEKVTTPDGLEASKVVWEARVSAMSEISGWPIDEVKAFKYRDTSPKLAQFGELERLTEIDMGPHPSYTACRAADPDTRSSAMLKAHEEWTNKQLYK
eukprot:TRINITY_DN47554_c0_g1_i1.p1 TRINITY_DN47554_c0_g1~~TRINITY_DN47554_c0_g1_i1.p1  ORF type:complete len:636 (-),score=88.13 TRINITY_DN47554_c0_g1_i1:202-2109(-)